ncbi:MAG: GxxExxY protein [Sandaracinaceae bacterium]
MPARHGFGGLTEAIIGACIEVHRHLGPGLLESTYEACLAHELARRRLKLERQKSVALGFKGLHVEHAYQLDLVVERRIVVEVKSVTALTTLHRAQLRTYLKLTGLSVGLLVNFNVPALREAGIRRVTAPHHR